MGAWVEAGLFPVLSPTPRPLSPQLLPPASCVRQNGDNMQNHAGSISRVFESQAEWAQWSLNLFPPGLRKKRHCCGFSAPG